eukprot:6236774-Pyramimonas_sp.AAC.1
MTKGKLGVQLNFATQALSKYNADPDMQTEYKKLKKHLKLFALADSLHANNIGQLQQSEMDAALTTVASVVRIPACVSVAVLKAKATAAALKASSVDHAIDLMRMTWPLSAGAVADESPTSPKLWQIDVVFADKRRLFIDLFIRTFFLKLIANGEAIVSDLLQAICLEFDRELTSVAESATITEDQAAFMCEMTCLVDT